MRHNAMIALAALVCAPAGADCYDLKVRATPIEQIPSEAPECADCIVMRWPWFVDLRIHRVLNGPVKAGVLRVLSVQHTWYVPRRGTWELRRNSLGGFNVLSGEGAHPKPCSPGALPARAYITPGKGATLDSLRAAGLARYGPAPR